MGMPLLLCWGIFSRDWEHEGHAEAASGVTLRASIKGVWRRVCSCGSSTSSQRSDGQDCMSLTTFS